MSKHDDHYDALLSWRSPWVPLEDPLTEAQAIAFLRRKGRIKELMVERSVDAAYMNQTTDARGFQEHLWRCCEEDLVRRLVNERLFNKTTVSNQIRFNAQTYQMSGMVLVPG